MAWSLFPTNQKTPVAPLISEEADRAIGKVVMVGLPLTIAASFLIPVSVVYLSLKFPHNPLFGQQSPLYYLSMLLWMVPAYVVFSKVYKMRLEFGRKYVGDKMWKEADAALGSFDQFGQKFFDRTGEAHYLWAIALDGIGKRTQAEKAREFIRSHRPNSAFVAKLGPPAVSVTLSASQLRKRESVSVPEPDTSGTTGNLKKTKRRRF
jgi:hypothetical protein